MTSITELTKCSGLLPANSLDSATNTQACLQVPSANTAQTADSGDDTDIDAIRSEDPAAQPLWIRKSIDVEAVDTRGKKDNVDSNSTEASPHEAEQLAWPKLLFLFVGLSLIVFVSSLDQTIVATAVPRIVAEFNGLGDVSWVGSAYLLTTAAVTPLYGKLAMIFGLRNILAFAIVMFIGGSLGCALSTNMLMLIVFRGVSGFGGESLYVLSLLVINGKLIRSAGSSGGEGARSTN